MIGNAPLSASTGVPGWETEAEEAALLELTRKYVPEKDGVIVELGVEYGRSTAQFAHAATHKKDTRIVSVDLYPDDHPIARMYGGLLNVWKNNLAEAGVIGLNIYLVPVRGVSWEIGKEWSEPIDLLFIDAGHTYEEVSKDIAAWVDHVKAGGVIVFHDYAKDENAHPLHHEVKRAVDEWYDNRTEKLERIDLPDSLVAFKRFEPAKTEKLAKINIKESHEKPIVERGASADQPAKKAATAKAKPATKAGKRTTKSPKK